MEVEDMLTRVETVLADVEVDAVRKTCRWTKPNRSNKRYRRQKMRRRE